MEQKMGLLQWVKTFLWGDEDYYIRRVQELNTGGVFNPNDIPGSDGVDDWDGLEDGEEYGDDEEEDDDDFEDDRDDTDYEEGKEE